MCMKSINAFFLYCILLLLIILGCKDVVTTVIQPRPHIESMFAINGNQTVTLGWTGILYGTAVELQIHRSLDSNFIPSNQTILTTISSSDTLYTDNGLTNGTRYYYSVVPIEKLSGGVKRPGTSYARSMARPYNYNTITDIKFSEHIQPIFQSSCGTNGCHDGSNSEAPRFREWEDFFKGGPHGAIVVPYRGNKSHVIYHMNTDTLLAPVSSPHMPLNGFNVPTNQVQLIKRWIDEGASNDEGAVAFSISSKGKLLVANQADDLVTVIDIATNMVMRCVQAGDTVRPNQIPSAPHHVRADAQGKYFYVTLINSQELWKFSVATHEFIQKVSVPPSPADVILTSTGDTAIVTNFSATTQIAALIDTRTMQVIKTFPIPPLVSFSHGALLSHDGKRLYTTNQSSGNLTQINLSDGSMDIIALDTSGARTSFTQPYLSDESPDGRFIYTACNSTNDVRMVDRTIDSTRATRIIPVGVRPLHVKVSPDGQYIISANQGSDNITFINASDYSTTTISGIAHQPHGIEFSPDGAFLYISCENRTEIIPPHHPTSGSKISGYVTVIDYATKTVIKSIEVGAFAAGISVVK